MTSFLSALTFFIPTNVLSGAVVVVILGLGLVFFLFWRRSDQELKRAERLLDELATNEALELMAESCTLQRESNRGNFENGFALTISCVLAGGDVSGSGDGEILTDPSPAYEKLKRNVIIRHLRSIFIAGCRESRLETEALIRHTGNELFKETFRLKNILSSFIIIGLFGTLIGLSDSLAELSPVLNFQDAQKNMDIATSLAGLLIHLKSAFAPSLWGILLTMAGLAIYVHFVSTRCNPLQAKLEHLTLNEWVPRLYPSVSYQLVQALTDNTNRFVQHVEDAAAVAGFAREVRECTGDFRSNMLDGITLLNGLKPHIDQFRLAAQQIDDTFARKLTDFSDRFEGTVCKLTGFQDQLMALQGELSDSATEFNVSMKTAIEFQNGRIEGLHGNMLRVLESLKISEETYVQNVASHVDESKRLLTAVRENKDSDSEKNREIAKSILQSSANRFEAIEARMHESFTDLITRLDANLRQLQANFDTYDVPIRKAAVKLETTAEQIDNYHQSLKKSLIQSNEDVLNKLRLLAEKNQEQNQQFLKTLLEHQQTATSQHSDTHKLTNALNDLVESMTMPVWKKLNPFGSKRVA